MSKRRNRNKEPNLPEATLQRARQQAGLPPTEDDEADEAPAENTPVSSSVMATPSTPAAPAAPAKPKPAPRASTRKRIEAASLERSKKRGITDAEAVAAMLANPTKIVTEAELRAEYSHVLIDLRNMALLAVALVVVLILLAQVI